MDLTRRTFLRSNLSAAIVGSLPTLAVAASPSQIERHSQLPSSGADRSYWNDWPDFVTRNMNQAGASRKALLEKVRSKEGVSRRTDLVREQVWHILGGRPESTPLNARVVGTIDRGEYRVEKIIFESMPGIYVTAHLYVPNQKKGICPGVLAPLGHTAAGKQYRSYQYCFQTLARLGYVVLAYDPFGEGERRQYLFADTGLTRFDVTPEHLQSGRPMILFGSGYARYSVWDGIRAMDYLVSRPEVDAKRIGCTGHSGGATVAMYLMALEPRIHTAVATEGNFENLAGPSYEPPGAIADAEQDLVMSLPLGLDRGDLLTAFAPKPFLLCYTKHDQGQTYSPVYEEGIKENYNELQRVYGILGEQEKLGCVGGHLPHGLDFFSRRLIYEWFNRWLGNADAGVEEREFDVSQEATLNCTATGQVLTSLGGRSITQLNTECLEELLPVGPFQHMKDISMARQQVCSQLSSLLSLPKRRESLNSLILSSDIGKNFQIDEIQYESEPGIRIVGWFVRSKEGRSRRPVIFYLSDNLVNNLVAELGPFEEIIAKGFAVCAVNLRGMGLSLPRLPSTGPVFYRAMSIAERHAWANLALGKPIIGQRCWDILRGLDYLRSRADVDTSQIRILGEGPAGLAALMAAALDDNVRAILLRRALLTYQSVVKSEDYALELDWFVPSILQHFDLPDIAAAVAPRPVWISDPLSAAGTLLSESFSREQILEKIPANSAAMANLHLRNTVGNDVQVCLDWLGNT